ncbi:hypothetical protein QYM36_007306, partial [Artemia franciscana]
VQRLQEYEKFLSSLRNATPLNFTSEVEDIGRALNKTSQLVRVVTEEGSELDRIQALFPGDDLFLRDKRALFQNMKNLARRKSTTAALQRALSSKSGKLSTPTSVKPNITEISPGLSAMARSPVQRRQFIMEAPVQFTTGLQSQDRHLFLFTDLLLVAKARSDGTFKLKEKVRLAELWLSDRCIDEVTEASRSKDSSFVIGWPTCNVVSTFGRNLTLRKFYFKVKIQTHLGLEVRPVSNMDLMCCVKDGLKTSKSSSRDVVIRKHLGWNLEDSNVKLKTWGSFEELDDYTSNTVDRSVDHIHFGILEGSDCNRKTCLGRRIPFLKSKIGGMGSSRPSASSCEKLVDEIDNSGFVNGAENLTHCQDHKNVPNKKKHVRDDLLECNFWESSSRDRSRLSSGGLALRKRSCLRLKDGDYKTNSIDVTDRYFFHFTA